MSQTEPTQLLLQSNKTDTMQVRSTYIVTIDRRVLEGGPSWAANPPEFDQAYADRVSKYYDVAGEDLSLG